MSKKKKFKVGDEVQLKDRNRHDPDGFGSHGVVQRLWDESGGWDAGDVQVRWTHFTEYKDSKTLLDGHTYSPEELVKIESVTPDEVEAAIESILRGSDV